MPEETSTRAVRLIFEYDGDDVRLVAQQPVELAPSQIDAMKGVRADHYVETRGEDGAALTRVPAPNAFVQSHEVFPEDPSEPITRVDSEAQGAFTVVVPTPPDAAGVAVMRMPAVEEPRDGLAPSPAPGTREGIELATFELER